MQGHAAWAPGSPRCVESKLIGGQGGPDHFKLEAKHGTLFPSSSLPRPRVSSVAFGR